MTSNSHGESWLQRLEGAAQTRQTRRRAALKQDAFMKDFPAILSTSMRRIISSDSFDSAATAPPDALSLHAALPLEATSEQIPPTPAIGDLNTKLNQAGVGQFRFSEGGNAVDVDELSYDVPVSSNRIWRFYGSSIYVAPAEELLSQATRAKWDAFIMSFQANFAHVKAEMIAEQCKSKQLRKQGCNLTNFMLEVRVSGRLDTPWSKSIKIGPCLWILCGSKWGRKRIREVSRGLTLPVDLSCQQIEVHTGIPLPSALKTIVPISRLPHHAMLNPGIEHMGGNIIYHVEGQILAANQRSPCGLLCCATYVKNGQVIEQHISRIGGLLALGKDGDQSEAAITTAHGIFSHLWVTDDPAEESEYEMEDSGFSLSSEPDDSDSDDACTSPTESLPMIGSRSASEVDFWVSMRDIHAVKYLGTQIPESSLASQNSSEPADYAIIGTGRLRGFQNVVDSTLSTTVTTHTNNAELHDGPLLLLLSPDNKPEATLLPGYVNLPMGNSEILLRKVRLDAPLAPGTSGTWLIRESKCCGMIIAAYPGEPLALFMTAEDILENIQVSFPGVIKTNSAEEAFPTYQHHGVQASSEIHASTASLELMKPKRKKVESEFRHAYGKTPGATIKTADQRPEYDDESRTALEPDQCVAQGRGSSTVSRPGSSRKSHTPKKYEYQWVWTCRVKVRVA
ncbi:hypothetical protein GQ607_016065 [Colletotrichum asianum]|uniref:Uncharacterized protein n=1 Tax=Colletotrichum asianum TaxID=702518 RepID=A0A8H3VWI6_9PEZI|nr:hypothetical protein GQ607_016065 [Colletotrichum asianum]